MLLLNVDVSCSSRTTFGCVRVRLINLIALNSHSGGYPNFEVEVRFIRSSVCLDIEDC